MFTKDQMKVASSACRFIDKTSGNHRILKDMDIVALCKGHYKFFKKVSCREKVGYKTFLMISRNTVCLNCKKKVPDGVGNCTSLCSICIASGFSIKKYKREKSEKTCIKKYGVRNPFQSEELMQTAKATNLERYGDINPGGKNSILRPAMDQCLRDTVEERLAVRRSNTESKYGEGITHWLQTPGGKEHFKEKMEERYGEGITNPMLYPKNKKHHKKRMSDLKAVGFWKEIYDTKVVPTIQKNHGVDNIRNDVEFMKAKRLEASGYEFPLQDPKSQAKFKATSLKHFGTEHPMHNSEIFEKCMVKQSRNVHIYRCCFRDRYTYSVMGTYEVFLLKYLLTKYNPKNILSGFNVPLIKTDGVKRTYYPDFLLKDENVYIECKSNYTLIGLKKFGYSLLKSNRFKARRCKELGINLVWVIPNPRLGTLLQLPSDWYTYSLSKLKRFIKNPGREVPVISEDRFQCHLLHKVGKI